MTILNALAHEHPGAGDTLLVDWNLGNHCNYACSYCPPHLRSGDIPWQSADTCRAFVRICADRAALVTRTLHFRFSGGEPTLCRWLPDILQAIHARGGTTGVISNGSMPVRWWETHRPLLNEVVLTYHLETATRHHFIDVVAVLVDSASIHVNVPVIPDRWDECLAVATDICNRWPSVTVTLKPLLKDFKTQLYDYAERELSQLSSYSLPARTLETRAFHRRGMIATFADASTARVTASRLVATRQNVFAGWQCAAGLEMIVVHANGDVFRANCREDGPIGRVQDGCVHWPTTGVRCTRPVCKCLADILLTKARPGGDERPPAE